LTGNQYRRHSYEYILYTVIKTGNNLSSSTNRFRWHDVKGLLGQCTKCETKSKHGATVSHSGCQEWVVLSTKLRAYSVSTDPRIKTAQHRRLQAITNSQVVKLTNFKPLLYKFSRSISNTFYRVSHYITSPNQHDSTQVSLYATDPANHSKPMLLHFVLSQANFHSKLRHTFPPMYAAKCVYLLSRD